MDGVLPLSSTFDAALSSANVFSAMTSRPATRASVDAAAREFEAMFASQLVKPMFDTVPVDDRFGGGQGEEVMRALLVQEYGRAIARTGTLGIASQVKEVMLKAQEAPGTRRALTKSKEIEKAERKDSFYEPPLTDGLFASSSASFDDRVTKEGLDVAY
ncbi:MAG: rod-binding protein [Alphaproteobacteria bacterium]|nr:rod-binding protein [Alphaproteobacteria bacterium]